MKAGALRSRAIGYFVEPAAPARPPAAPGADVRLFGPAAVASTSRGGATRLPLRAAVLGSPAAAPPIAGALACALRAAARSGTAAVAVWAPGGRSGEPPRHAGATTTPRLESDVRTRNGEASTAPRLVSDARTRNGAAIAAPRRGPASPAASRLAARLSARGLAASARGRLAWVALDGHPVAAAVAARRVAGALEVPFVTVLAGPRCEVVEGLIAEQDLVLVVADDPDGPLARLAIESCTPAAFACAPHGAVAHRWLALAGLGGERVLSTQVRELVRDLADPPALPHEQLAW